ncbi:MAG TPA: redox-regulated ATPase YchF [Dehalococcoidia bacterium]|nr:redox-regulated ATPase YchF [Dehalococcoidia bacterium]
MECGIVGLPKSGKTTVFNALTRGTAEVSPHPSAASQPNVGMAKIPDPRLQQLEELFHPKRSVPAEIRLIDIPAPAQSFGRGGGLSRQFVTHLSPVDTLLHVVRAFEEESLPHTEGSLDPARDVATLDLELAFSDLLILERRVERLGEALKGAKAHEREPLLREQALLAKIKAALEQEIPVYAQGLDPEEAKAIRHYRFLTTKPLLVVLNIGESQIAQAQQLESELLRRYSRPRFQVAALCGKLEMELSQLGDDEAREYALALGLEEQRRYRVLQLCYQLAGAVTFYTVVSHETRAWTIPQGTSALKAAGKIHSDMERGFIRAEVVSFDDLAKCGSLSEARKHGLLHVEGKEYIVHDGDVITFLFNV